VLFSRLALLLRRSTPHRQILGVLAAAVGAAVGLALEIPAALIVGPLAGSLVAGLIGIPIAAPKHIQRPVQLALGLIIGSHFAVSISGDAIALLILVVAVIISSLVMTVLGYWYLRKVGGYDRVTSACSALPGGAYVAVLMGSEMGGDMRAMSLMQAFRVVATVMTIPLLAPLFVADPHPVQAGLAAVPDITPADAAILIASGLAAAFLGLKLKVPGGGILPPMAASGLLFGTGIVTGHIPDWASFFCAFLLGWAMGVRFGGISIAELLRHLRHGTALVVAMIALTMAMAVLLAPIFGRGLAETMLGLAPGGIGEMSVTAVLIGVDAGFVGALQTTRLVMINVALPFIARMAKRDDADAAGGGG
jgi:membrane AbrB-like protein